MEEAMVQFMAKVDARFQDHDIALKNNENTMRSIERTVSSPRGFDIFLYHYITCHDFVHLRIFTTVAINCDATARQSNNMVDLRCTLNIRVGGKVVRRSQSKYLNGVIAEMKVDPDSFTFYELVDNIRQMGYGITDFNGVTEYITVFYRLPMHDTKNGLVELTSHDDMLKMFAAHSGRKYMIIDVYVHCPNVVESDEHCEDEVEVICRETNSIANPSSITELGGDLNVGGHIVEHLHGDGVEHIVQEGCDEEEVEHIVQEGVDAEEMDEDSDSDCEWQPNDDSESSCGSFSGIEESSDEEVEETIPLGVMVVGGRGIQNEGGRGRGVIGGRGRGIQIEGGRGRGVIGGRGRGIQNEGGRGRGVIRGRGRGVTGGRGRGVPTASRGTGGVNNGSRGNGRGRAIGPNSGVFANNGLVVKGRGPNQGILIGRERAVNTQMVLGRGRGGTTAPLPGVVIRDRNPNIEVDLGTNKGANSGKGKEPMVGKAKIPMTRFGGAESIIPRVGLPIPQGWRRSTRIRNAFFWSQTTSSSAASCGSGSGSGSATMPNTHIPRLDSQGATSTPSTQRSAT
ncbi:hypothetical protein RHGRI_030026 [Rhododendron griersonianum]|uniref:Uncharacterized protein n=1 Tax=Rhododendron griersonianum TaxID=479676 RepID=A0AAV6IQ35_9ERIC|nr:hypothetical protein RHGRI_030026 [Rhododendron griersonianum]